MGGFRRFPSSRRYRSRGTLSRSEGEKSWMDISEVGQICVPLISAGKGEGHGLEVTRKRKAGWDAREPSPSPPFICPYRGSPPRWVCFAIKGRIPSPCKGQGADQAREKSCFCSEMKQVTQPKQGEEYRKPIWRQKGSSQHGQCLAGKKTAPALPLPDATAIARSTILHLCGSILLFHVKPHSHCPINKHCSMWKWWRHATCWDQCPAWQLLHKRVFPVQVLQPPNQSLKYESPALFPQCTEGFWQECSILAPLQIARTAGHWTSKSRNIWLDQEWFSVFFSNVLAVFTHFTGQHHQVAMLCLEQRETAQVGLPRQPPSQPCSPCSFLCEALLES